MEESSSMWKCPGNSRTAFASSRLFETLLALAVAFLVTSCAGRPALAPPRTNFVDPAAFSSGPSDSQYQQAYRIYLQGDQRNARVEFQKVLKKHPGDPATLLAVGYTYIAENNPDLAEKFIRKSLESSPDLAQAHFALSTILEAKQDYDGALAELATVQQLRPNYPSIDQNRNILRLKTVEWHLNEARKIGNSNPEAALLHFQAARAIAPEVTQIPLEIAQLLVRGNRCEDAVPYLEDVLKDTPGEPEATMTLADCYVDLQRYDDALALYQELASTAPGAELDKKIEDLKKTIAFLKMPEEYQRISKDDQLNRAQVAALLVTELPFLQKYRMSNSEIMVDILNHWARSYIQKVVDLGIMDAYPNRTFEPKEAVTKLEMAKAAARLVQILSENEGKRIAVINENPQFPDVPPSNVNYSAISAAVSYGVLSPDADGRFHPGRPVSGAEAMSMVNRLKTLSE